MALVRRLAQRYARRGEALEDLTQVGCVGLIKAIDRFDGQYGVGLATYAAPNILGEIKRHFRDKGWTIHVPRDVQDLNVRLARVTDELTVQLGRAPSVDELAEATHSRRERVVEALECSRAYSATSLSEWSGDEDSPMDSLGADDGGYGRSDDRQLLRQGLRVLPRRERAILHLRFFEGLTQSEIAARVGVSQMHVSRLIRQSIDRVRDELTRGAPQV
ncbi:MAG: SigB/SigF/SigG family RNA polymerase sigma factor [Thermoleophilaceae bacterium]|nr:SigB/SigF/SigG family RNA polymerase sigma factor [Thermoleophilaceae bacterium]